MAWQRIAPTSVSTGALKRILRDKANFGVLEGFLTTVLNTRIIIRKIFNIEELVGRDKLKYNRVDLLVENSDRDLLLVEVQGETEFAYYKRMLFGASKLVTDYINGG